MLKVLNSFKFRLYFHLLHFPLPKGMWGRTAGLLFAGPLVYFAGRGVLRARLGANLTGLFALGLSQAFVGWWMVRHPMKSRIR